MYASIKSPFSVFLIMLLTTLLTTAFHVTSAAPASLLQKRDTYIPAFKFEHPSVNGALYNDVDKTLFVIVHLENNNNGLSDTDLSNIQVGLTLSDDDQSDGSSSSSSSSSSSNNNNSKDAKGYQIIDGQHSIMQLSNGVKVQVKQDLPRRLRVLTANYQDRDRKYHAVESEPFMF